MNLAKILLIDDDEDFCKTQQFLLSKKGYTVIWSTNPEEAIGLIAKEDPACVVLDLKLRRADGLEVLERIRAHDPNLPILMLTGYESIKTAVEAVKRGAFHYLTKSLDCEELLVVLEKAIEHRGLFQQIEEMKAKLGEFDNLEPAMGGSEKIRHVIRLVRAVAATDVNVLVVGESGTGKELVSRAIHLQSGRHKAPFITVDCASIPETLIESELFGHEKGAFTGAIATVKGKFETADGGTLFLDEIANIPLTVQAKLLRFLETHEFERIGNREVRQTSVRVIAASNRDPEAMVKEGHFRQDLLYRLKEFPIPLPPLRERREDIPLLCHKFLRELDPEVGRNVKEISPAALALLQVYHFPGNVRELRNIIKRAMVVANGRVEARDLPAELQGHHHPLPTGQGPSLREICKEATLQVERQMIVEALQKTHGHHGKAATILGITSRTLYNKIREYRIEERS